MTPGSASRGLRELTLLAGLPPKELPEELPQQGGEKPAYGRNDEFHV